MKLSLIRSLLFTDPVIILLTLVLGIWSLCISYFDPSGNRQHEIARIWAWLILKVSRVSITVAGIEKLDLARNYVFVSNHLSYMDTPALVGSLPFQFRFFAKLGLFQIPIMGGHLRRSGHFPVVKDNPRASLRSLNDGAKYMRDRGASVMLFPEGGRSTDGKVQPFKDGAAFIAIKMGVPVVPIAIVGTREVLPSGSGVIMPGTVELRISDPISTESLTIKDREKLTNQLRERIVALLEGSAVRV